MNTIKLWTVAAVVLLCGTSVFTSCYDGKALNKVSCVLDSPIVDKAPEKVRQAMADAKKFHLFEIMKDTANNISISGIGELDNGQSAEDYGVVVVKNATSTLFPDIRNSRRPSAFYDAETKCCWLAAGVMEGTGTHVEQLYKIEFGTADDSARIAATIEPYQMQKKFEEGFRYNIEGDDMTFYVNGVEVASAKNTVTDMGGFDSEQPVWIGEQISYYMNDGKMRVCFVPGIKFTTGLVLTYDNMPSISACVELDDKGDIHLSDFKADTEKEVK